MASTAQPEESLIPPQALPEQRSRSRSWVKWLSLSGVVVALAGSAIYLLPKAFNNAPVSNTPTTIAKITTLQDKVVEQGELESQSTINCVCQIDRYENKIISLAPEGKLVKKGEVVVQFDPSEITKEIAERDARIIEETAELETAEQELKVQEDENVISLRTAKQTLLFADLDLKKYVEGDYLVKKSEIEGSISEAQTAVDKARRDRENMRALVKRGFREYEQLREADQVVKSTELRLKNAQQKLDSLEKFEHVKSLAEFKGKAEEAKYKLKIAETTAAAKLAKSKDRVINQQRSLAMQQDRMKKLKQDLEYHSIKAPQDGTLTYARQRWRENGAKMHEGSIVDQNQIVVILPDMTRMQVKVGVHETMVSKVKVGQTAVVRVDAFSGKPLTGRVKSVSDVSASTRYNRSRDYHVEVTIDSFPEDMKIKPGMTAEVEILVGQYPDVLVVPIQSVTNFGQKKYVFVDDGQGKVEAQEVQTGKTNLSFVEITSGLSEGQSVALDAYQRGLEEFSGLEPEAEIQNEPVADAAIEPAAKMDVQPALEKPE